MIVLGASLGSTVYGKKLYDGGSCLIDNHGKITAIAEERLSRVKHDGGFEYSSKYCLSEAGITLAEVDMIALSSCVEPLRKVDCSLGIPEEALEKVRIVPHHLAHAYSAFLFSPFEKAIIMVVDGGGDILEPLKSTKWWEHKREQNTYFLGNGKNIELLERQFDQPFDTGFGEVYRGITEYLGFENFFNASKVMSLAAYDVDLSEFANTTLFYYEGDRIECTMRNYPPRVVSMIQEWSDQQRITLPPQRVPTEPFSQEHMKLARFVQQELENAFIKEVCKLHKLTNLTNLCIAGGVGLNCVLNGRILAETPIKNLFVQPAPGDTGQCLGNAIWAYSNFYSKYRRDRTPFSIFLGRQPNLEKEHILSLSHTDYLQINTSKDISKRVAELLSRGNIVGWFQGRSEFGPRALGGRSILADPRFRGIAKKVARAKGREYFQPFAPSVLAEKAHEYFYLQNIDYSYMTITAKVKEGVEDYIPNVVHVDHTARIHLVTADNNPKFYNLIKEFFLLTGIPLILNTSLNKRGEPIVETPLDAIKSFRQMELDYLVIGELIFSKKERTNSENTRFSSNTPSRYDTTYSLDTLLPQLSVDFPDNNIALRSAFGLYYEYWDWITTGRKKTTVRYRQNAIDIPLNDVLPISISKQGLVPDSKNYKAGSVKISSFVVKHLNELTEVDGINDGFSGSVELIVALRNYYGPIDDDQYVTIYNIAPVDTK